MTQIKFVKEIPIINGTYKKEILDQLKQDKQIENLFK